MWRAGGKAALLDAACDRRMRSNAAVYQSEPRLAGRRHRRHGGGRQSPAGAARDIDMIGVDFGIGKQLGETFLRAGETMSVGDGETNDVEVDAFDAVAIDQQEAVLRRASDHRIVAPRRDEEAAPRGLAVAVGCDAVAIVAGQRRGPVEPTLRARTAYA